MSRVYNSVAKSLSTYHTDAISSVVVGYSGGLDSHVLLIAAQRWCRERGANIRAVYIDHGLQADSEDWARHCRGICETIGITFESVSVKVESGHGKSPEEAARNARYTVLGQHMQRGDLLLTAHHAHDQAETLLLQLLRGAGVQGLASMPECKPFATGRQLRPLLNLTRTELELAATAMQLHWVEDSSNRDNRYDRNYLRQQILPLLSSRWPAAVEGLGRSAAHAAQAAALLHELAAEDIALQSDTLDIAILQALPAARLMNALRAWICLLYTSPSPRDS